MDTRWRTDIEDLPLIDKIGDLTTHLSLGTSNLVRQAILRALENGTELDGLWQRWWKEQDASASQAMLDRIVVLSEALRGGPAC